MKMMNFAHSAINRITNIQLFQLLAVLILISGLAACGEPPYKNINNDELQALLDQGIPVYDIRRPEEWLETGVIEDSTLLTFVDANGRVVPGFIEKFTANNSPDKPVILICRTGNRTSTLARYLADELGYTQVYNVRHGITHWIRENRPVKRLN